MQISTAERARVLTQALPYIKQYAGKTVVIKYGGNAMISEELKSAVMEDIVLLSTVGIHVVLVHGGGPEINAMLKKIGKESRFVGGLRYTDRETMDVVEMVLAGKVNKSLVQQLEQHGGRAIGLCGLDGGMIKAVKHREADLGYVGDITHVNVTLIRNSLENGTIPVVATIAAGESDGETYNINADTAAAQIAAAMGAEQGGRKLPHLGGAGQRGGASQTPGHHLRRYDPQDRLLRGSGAAGCAANPYHRRADPPFHPDRDAHRRGHRHHVFIRRRTKPAERIWLT